ncbi:MAG: hypothetical protein IJC97_02285 [Oscillospiraceae bacterium]|nr:hypothetical protein [Oscillospiraceae bacterium]
MKKVATIQTTIKLYDGVSAPLKLIKNALNTVTDSFKHLNASSTNAIDNSAIKHSCDELSQLKTIISDVENNIVTANEKQRQFNYSLEQSSSLADNLGSKIKSLVSAFVGISTIKKSINFIKDAIESADLQTKAQLQLQVSLQNMGAADSVYNSIVNKAKEIQSQGIYSDEAMIAAAAEFATYMTDTSAIEMMMDTLSNYAAGMSGGTALDINTLVQYATNLGKITAGAYDAMAKKGFKFTEVQKAVINGTATETQYVETLGKNYKDMSQDMRTASVISNVIAESWANLYETMSNTPEGRITALKNAWNNLKETIGTQFADTIVNITDKLSSAVSWLSANLTMIEPIILGLIAATLTYAAAKTILAAATWIATGAAKVFFTTLLTNPILWLAVIIGIAVAYIYKWIQSVGSLQIAWQICMNALLTLWENMKYAFYSVYVSIVNSIGSMKVEILNILQSMINSAISLINKFIGLLNKIPGVNIDLIADVSFGTTAAIENVIKNRTRREDLNAYKEKIQAAQDTRIAAIEALKQSASKSDVYTTNSIIGNMYDTNSTLDGIYTNTNNAAQNTATVADNISSLSDSLEYLVDIAERETINRFTTAEIKVEMTNNNSINSSLDLDGVVDYLAASVQTAMESSAEGVHI